MCLPGAFSIVLWVLTVHSGNWFNTINSFPVQQPSPVWMTFNTCLFLSMCPPFRYLTSSQFQVPIMSFEGSDKLKDFFLFSSRDVLMLSKVKMHFLSKLGGRKDTLSIFKANYLFTDSVSNYWVFPVLRTSCWVLGRVPTEMKIMQI